MSHVTMGPSHGDSANQEALSLFSESTRKHSVPSFSNVGKLHKSRAVFFVSDKNSSQMKSMSLSYDAWTLYMSHCLDIFAQACLVGR
jgi:hypothetical protein